MQEQHHELKLCVSVALVALMAAAHAAGPTSVVLPGRFATDRDERGIAIPEVRVSGTGANDRLSDAFGRFELMFSGKKPADEVQVVYKYRDWELVNHASLPYVLRNPPAPILQLILSPPSEVRQRRVTYYAGPSIESANKEFEQKTSEAQRAVATGRITQSELETQRKQLEVERDRKVSIAKETADHLANVPAARQDRQFRSAMEEMANGNADRALILMKARNDSLVKAAPGTSPAAPVLFQAQLQQLTGDFAGADQTLRKATALDPNSPLVRQGLGAYQLRVNRPDLGRPNLLRALELARGVGGVQDAASVLGELGAVSGAELQLDESRRYLTQAILLREHFAKRSGVVNDRKLATLYDELGRTELKANRTSEALTNMEQALKLYKGMEVQNQLLDRPRLSTLESQVRNVRESSGQVQP